MPVPEGVDPVEFAICQRRGHPVDFSQDPTTCTKCGSVFARRREGGRVNHKPKPTPHTPLSGNLPPI
jgi:hypothetical protein